MFYQVEEFASFCGIYLYDMNVVFHYKCFLFCFVFFHRQRIWGKFHQSLIDVENPDFDKHPEFRNAVSIDIELSAGEMLFIPKLWWHHVRTLEPSISVNFWFQHFGSEKLKLTRHCIYHIRFTHETR
jgi:hypothetical protein